MNQKHPIYLVSCGKSKRPVASEAHDLYTGALFRKSFELAGRMADQNDGERFILSAQHGLLMPMEMVEPYDLALSHLSSMDRKAWGFHAVQQLAALYDDAVPLHEMRFAILAGAAYVDAVRWGLCETLGYVPEIQAPMHGLGQGKRLAWLNERLAATA